MLTLLVFVARPSLVLCTLDILGSSSFLNRQQGAFLSLARDQSGWRGVSKQLASGQSTSSLLSMTENRRSFSRTDNRDPEMMNCHF